MNAMNNATMGAQALGSSGQDRGPSLLAIQIVMMALATTAVLLRFIARRMGPGVWWDDWTILAALACILSVSKTYEAANIS